MSKTINAARKNYRWQLLASASAFALLSSLYGASEALAETGASAQPPLWLELGGQFERVGGGKELFAPDFVATIPDTLGSPLKLQRALAWSYGGDIGLSFQPEDSDWVFSAAIRYGRAAGHRKAHEQTATTSELRFHRSIPATGFQFNYTYAGQATHFAEADASNGETHAIADFKAGRDVGLGMFGSAVAGLGVRFAQINSKSGAAINADPDTHFSKFQYTFIVDKNCHRVGNVRVCDHFQEYVTRYNVNWHEFTSQAYSERSFQGIGPSISWEASSPLSGNVQDGELTLDWAANAALLFGRQRARGHHQTEASYRCGKYCAFYLTQDVNPPADHDRTKNVVVPNIGGALGLSYRIEDFKVSMGYRADMFFNAIDGGIDAQKSHNRGYYGPFASISVGIGD